jgi:sec-independent protein translocase protein TatA
MGALSPVHLVIILAIALLVIGPGKLPETGAALGRAIRDFRQAVDGSHDAAAPASTAPVGPSTVTASTAPAGPPAGRGAAPAATGTTEPS